MTTRPSRHRQRRTGALLLLAVAAALGTWSVHPRADRPGGATRAAVVAPPATTGTTATTTPTRDVYAADRPGMLSPAVRRMRPLLYVPNSQDDTVDEIDPRTFKVVRHFRVGREPQHVVPSWDLKRLWVASDKGDSLTPVDPRDGHPGKPVHVTDPYNLYFTPDGREAIVVAEAEARLDFRDPHTMAPRRGVPVPCAGVDHMDFAADGSFAVASCEFSGQLLVVDLARHRVAGTVTLNRAAVGAPAAAPDRATPGHEVMAQGHGGPMPQDVKLSPDGATFYVADMASDGVWLVDGVRPRVTGFVRTGKGAHGLYVSRDSRTLFVSNRGEGSVSLIDLATRRVTRTWRLPGGGSPDMGGVSADGRVLWLSGRYHGEVYAIDTTTGRLLHRIKVGRGPHGLCVYPQPGRYSLGHTGVFR